MKFFGIIVIYILFSTISVGQTDKGFPVLSESDFEGMKIQRTEYYDGNSLWGLINGGADVYLEYGFKELGFQEVEWKGFNFRIELYRMLDVTSAYGIFSASLYKCASRDTITKYICINPFQVQAAIGDYYISIANDKGTNEAQSVTLNIFSKIVSRMEKHYFAMPPFFDKEIFSQYIHNFKVVKGGLGFQNAFPMWEKMFEDFEYYEVDILPIEDERGFAYVSLIKFRTEKDAKRFVADNPEGDTRIIKMISSTEIIFIETNMNKNDVEEILHLHNN
ncbi:MAG: hypothetical protein Q8N03_15835 [Ignavibacteria bacterium]|nr:hypothetical protein [Ignavibacteria bacterium]